MESVITDKGVVLLGEAAQRYVGYLYFDSILKAAVILIFIVTFATVIRRMMARLRN